jgi:hypothetical protein
MASKPPEIFTKLPLGFNKNAPSNTAIIEITIAEIVIRVLIDFIIYLTGVLKAHWIKGICKGKRNQEPRIKNQLDSRLKVTSIAYHQLPTQITINTKAVNFGAHFCLVNIPIAAIISVIPLPRTHKDSFPKNGGIKASKTPGFTK